MQLGDKKLIVQRASLGAKNSQVVSSSLPYIWIAWKSFFKELIIHRPKLIFHFILYVLFTLVLVVFPAGSAPDSGFEPEPGSGSSDGGSVSDEHDRSRGAGGRGGVRR